MKIQKINYKGVEFMYHKWDYENRYEQYSFVTFKLNGLTFRKGESGRLKGPWLLEINEENMPKIIDQLIERYQNIKDSNPRVSQKLNALVNFKNL